MLNCATRSLLWPYVLVFLAGSAVGLLTAATLLAYAEAIWDAASEWDRPATPIVDWERVLEEAQEVGF